MIQLNIYSKNKLLHGNIVMEVLQGTFFSIINVRATVIYVVLSNIFVGFKECKIGNSAT